MADRLEEVTVRTAFTEEDRVFIGRCTMFFAATADADGQPDCSYKGGLPGFVRVEAPATMYAWAYGQYFVPILDAIAGNRLAEKVWPRVPPAWNIRAKT